MAANFVPDEATVHAICNLFQRSQDPTANQSVVYMEVEELSRRSDLPFYLIFIFNCREISPVLRQCAGLFLKKVIPNVYPSLPHEAKCFLKNEFLRSLGDSDEQIRFTVGILVSEVLRTENEFQDWPSLLPDLVSFLQYDDLLVVHGSLGVVEKVCEDFIMRVQNSPSILLEKLIPLLIHFLSSPHEPFRRMALHSLNQFLLDLPGAFLAFLDPFLQGLSSIAFDSSPSIRLLVCRAFSMLVERRFENMQPHLDFVVEYMLSHSSPSLELPLALEACEFWIALADSDALNTFQKYLPRVLQALHQCSVYSPEELLPFLSENKNFQSEEFDPAGVTSGWTLRKCSSFSLEALSATLGDAILPMFFPILEQKLFSPCENILEVEAAILMLGIIADSCGSSIVPFFSTLIPRLISLTETPPLHVQVISIWCLGKYSDWICSHSPVYFKTVLDIFLRNLLQEDQKLKVASCSALSTLEESTESSALLVPHLELIVSHLTEALRVYSPNILFFLYDTIATLFENSGPEIFHPSLISRISPSLLHLLTQTDPEESEMIGPIFSCFSSLFTSLSNAPPESVSFISEFVTGPPDHPVSFACTTFEFCLKTIHSSFVRVNEQGSLDAHEKDIIVDSLNLLSGMVSGLKTHLVPLIQKSSFGAIFMQSLQCEDTSIRQHSFNLLGEIAKYLFFLIQPILLHIIEVLLNNLSANNMGLCNNATWALVEISVQNGEVMEKFIDVALEKWGTVCLTAAEMYPPLVSSIALAIGKLCLVSPFAFSQKMDVFLGDWCEHIQSAVNSDEKEVAFRGICCLLKQNPEGALPFFSDVALTLIQYFDDAPDGM